MLQIKIAYVSENSSLAAVRKDIFKATIVSLDTETTGLDSLTNKIRLVQLATSEAVWVLDMFQLSKKAVWELILEPLFSNKNIVKILQNAKFDLKFIQTNFGDVLSIAESVYDTYIAAKLIDGGQYTGAGLDDLASKYLGIHLDKSYQRYDWAGTLYKEPIAYAGLDAAVLLPLYRMQCKALADNKLLRVAKIEFECLTALAQMELNGITIDRDKWIAQAEVVKEDMYQQELLLRKYFGDINLGSNQQLGQVLSSMTGMDIKSVAKQALEDLLKGYYEKPDLFGRVMDYRVPVMRLQEYNKMKKMHDSFGLNFLKNIHPVTKRIHSSFTQIETNTGRLSSKAPNLQNIKRDSDIRGSFVAPEGKLFWQSDYSQIELRIIAQFSKDEAYVHAFENKIDIHSSTARGMFGCELGKENTEQRVSAKICNFSIPYGVGKGSYAVQRGGIPLKQAESEIKAFYNSHPGLVAWHREQFRYFQEYNCVRSASGRIRALPHWRYDEYASQQAAKNMPIQATSADIIKLAMARCQRELPTDVQLVLSVHDELIFEGDEKVILEIGPEIDRIMRECAEEFVPDIPIKIDGHSGAVWSKG